MCLNNQYLIITQFYMSFNLPNNWSKLTQLEWMHSTIHFYICLYFLCKEIGIHLDFHQFDRSIWRLAGESPAPISISIRSLLLHFDYILFLSFFTPKDAAFFLLEFIFSLTVLSLRAPKSAAPLLSFSSASKAGPGKQRLSKLFSFGWFNCSCVLHSWVLLCEKRFCRSF